MMETGERLITQVEIRTRDLKRAISFYKGVFDWDIHETAPGYAVIDTGVPPLASIWETPDPRFRLGVCNNVTVEDCRQDAERAVRLGGRISVPYLELPDSGRFTATQDPWGNEICLWEPLRRGRPNLGGSGRNPIVLYEIATPDLAAGIAYYSSLLGWTFGVGGFTFSYALTEGIGLQVGVGLVGGPDANRVRGTTNYVAVDNLGRCAERVKESGGAIVLGPGDLAGEGRYFIFEDLDRNRVGVLQVA
jgi:predicted enzyme related to lactoylglutathione lyase